MDRQSKEHWKALEIARLLDGADMIITTFGNARAVENRHFKNNYCSATEWNIDKLNCQAIKYNLRFGPGAFIFSLGFVRPPQGLQLNCYGLLAAVPLSKGGVAGFIEKRI
eukprot:UN10410